MLSVSIAIVSPTEVRLELRPSDGAAGRATCGCLVTFAETDGDDNAPEAILAFRGAHSGLCNGEQAACWSELCGRVVAHRRHGSALLFVDLRAGDETVQTVFSSDASDAAFALATRRGSLVRARGVPGRSRRGEMSLFASSIAILRLPPEADAVLACAKLAAASQMSVAAAARLLGCDAPAMREVVHAVETASDAVWDAAEAIADDSAAGEAGPTPQRAARELASALAGRRMRARPARYLKAELGTLDRLAAAHGLAWPMGPESSLDCSLADLDEEALGDLHPARGLPPVGEADAKLRAQYIERKKLPQLRWMLAQIDAVIAERYSGGGRGAGAGGSGVACGEAPPTILDLGCGRADLTLLLAARYPSFRVVGLDSNGSSLQSAVARAQAARLSNVSFLLADAAPQAAGEADGAPERSGAGESAVDALLPSTPDVLVALHACGGLSDVALGLAARWRASAVVCSCCFNKHRRLSPALRWGISEADKDVLCRMADCELPSLSTPARHLASSLRLRRFQQDLAAGGHGRAEAGRRPEAGAVADARTQGGDADEMGASLAVRCFDPAYSAQNTVLVARVWK